MNIIQIGCYDGNDHVYDYVSENFKDITSLHLIEPLSQALELARERYSKFDFVKFYEMAIVDTDISEIEFFFPTNFERCQTSSINQNHSRHFETDIVSKIVKASTLEKFLESNNLFRVDRLYIDTEGLDCKILNSVDLNKFRIDYIEYEYVHSDGTHNFGEIGLALERKLESFGYKIQESDSSTFNKTAIL